MKTTCMNPQEIHEGDLLAYIGGEASPEVAAHVARCAFCTAEAAALQFLETAVQTTWPRRDCPETDVLMQFHMGMLLAAERQRAQAHLAACAACQAELQQFLPVPVAPSWLERLRLAGKDLLEAIQVPATMQPVLVVRGSSSAQAYRVGRYQVLLAIEPPIVTENRGGLEGQVTRDDDPTADLTGQVSLWQAETLMVQDVVDKFGYFELENIASGVYTLHIDLLVDDMIVSNVTIP